MQSQSSSVATRNGVIAGIVLGVLSLPVITLSAIGRTFGAGNRGWIGFLLIALIVFAVAAFSASRRNGLLRSGVWAGVLAALVTLFIAICVGVVIVTLLAPYALLAASVARRAGHPGVRLALAGRLIVIRVLLGSLALLLAGLVAGLIGGALGRLGHSGHSGHSGHASGGPGQGAPSIATAPDANAPTQAYVAPMAAHAQGYPPAPPSATPPVYYPSPDDDSEPTTLLDSQR